MIGSDRLRGQAGLRDLPDLDLPRDTEDEHDTARFTARRHPDLPATGRHHGRGRPAGMLILAGVIVAAALAAWPLLT